MKRPRLLCMADLSVSPETRSMLAKETVLLEAMPARENLLCLIGGLLVN